jgi:polyisoprenoid-binding protein YceI
MAAMTDLANLIPTTTPTTGLPLKPGTYTLDRSHVHVGFAIRHLGVAKVRGQFKDVDAELVVGQTVDDTAVTAVVQLASIDTGNADRDAHTRSADLLDVERRPTMTFRSTTLRPAGDDWKLQGDLTIGDETHPITFDVEFGGVADFVDGTRHAGFSAVGELRRHDFGLHFGAIDPLIGQAVKIELEIEFLEPA